MSRGHFDEPIGGSRCIQLPLAISIGYVVEDINARLTMPVKDIEAVDDHIELGWRCPSRGSTDKAKNQIYEALRSV